MKAKEIHPLTASLRSVPAAKPKKDPKADLSATLFDLPAMISATSAPTNGPTIMVRGPKIGNIKPKIKPIVDPRTPAFEPPIFFVPQMGRT